MEDKTDRKSICVFANSASFCESVHSPCLIQNFVLDKNFILKDTYFYIIYMLSQEFLLSGNYS